MRHLPYDVSRCSNDKCGISRVCARFMSWPEKILYLPISPFSPDANNQCHHFTHWDSEQGVMDEPEEPK